MQMRGDPEPTWFWQRSQGGGQVVQDPESSSVSFSEPRPLPKPAGFLLSGKSTCFTVFSHHQPSTTNQPPSS
jgi:hypothetical protein